MTVRTTDHTFQIERIYYQKINHIQAFTTSWLVSDVDKSGCRAKNCDKDVLYKFSTFKPNFRKLVTLQLIGKYGGKKINDKSGVL